MKKYALVSCLAGLLLLTGSCTKNDDNQYCMPDTPVRKVRYELFTDQDFSGLQELITFHVNMQLGDRAIFDSALAPMRVEDIPDSSHRIIIEKQVPDDVTETLAVGFTYAIDEVGNAVFREPFPAGDTLKIVRFSFR